MTEHTTILPTDAKERKTFPMYSGLVAYFPDALAMVSKTSWIGNEQHHPGTPLHWDKAKSSDEMDALLRHASQGDWCEVAWRALANLQRKIDAGWRPAWWTDAQTAHPSGKTAQPEDFPPPPEGEQWHNPAGLTPEQVGVKDGWRLALKSEVSEGSGLAKKSVAFIRDAGWSLAGHWDCDSTYLTYRTREPLPKKEPRVWEYDASHSYDCIRFIAVGPTEKQRCVRYDGVYLQFESGTFPLSNRNLWRPLYGPEADAAIAAIEKAEREAGL